MVHLLTPLPPVEAFLGRLRELPFVLGVKLMPSRASGEWCVSIKTSRRLHKFRLDYKPGGLRPAVLERVLSQHNPDDPVAMLFSDHVPPAATQELARRRVNFVDLAGNCFLRLGTDHVAEVLGRKAELVRPPHASSAARSRVLTGLLLRPELVGASTRAISQRLGVSKSSVALSLSELEGQGVLGRSTGGRQLVRRGLLDRWLQGYLESLRPHLVEGRFAAEEPDPVALEARLLRQLKGQERPYALSGAAAAYREHHHYRGEQTAIFFDGFEWGLVRALRLAAKKDGPVTLLRSPVPLAGLIEKTRLAPWLLVYGDLLAEGSPRAREAAEEVRQKHLGDIS